MKFSKYNTVLEKNGVMLIHNTLNNTAIKISDSSLKKRIGEMQKGQVSNNEDEFICDLKKLNIIVEDHVNEKDLVNLKYFRYLSDDTLEIMLIVTRNCNFRCPYCYEKHESDKVMKWETYQKIIKLVETILNAKKIKKIVVGFFGGEPTLETKNIILFMKELNRIIPVEVNISGHMTTNGFLLSSKSFEDFVKCGISQFQVTIDGLEETHNKTRVWDSDVGTWRTIIDNLIAIKSLKLNYSVIIRTNFTEEIYAKSSEWIKFLAENFGGDNRFNFYCEAVKNLGVDTDLRQFKSVSESTVLNEMMKKADEGNLNMSTYLKRLNPFGWMCYAAKINSFIIDYDGILRKCTVALDEERNKVGDLYSECWLDEERLSWWTSYDLFDECVECNIYPICYGRKCPNAYFTETTCSKLKEVYNETLNLLF